MPIMEYAIATISVELIGRWKCTLGHMWAYVLVDNYAIRK